MSTQDLIVLSPEQLGLYHTALKNIINHTGQIKNKILANLKRIHSENLKTDLGLSFLDVKYHLLQDYLTSLTFYALLKVQGRSVEGHPVTLKLIETRTHLEKMKPIEAKLKYQMDKLVRATNTQVPKEPTSLLERDPLQFKPNPENLVNEAGAENDDENEDKVYRAPKIAPMPFDDRPLSSKKEREDKRQRERAARSRLMQDLVNDFDDRPEEQRIIGAFEETEDPELADRNRYEEENLIRLQPSKKTKWKLREMQKGLLDNELLNLDDFYGVSSINALESSPGNHDTLDSPPAREARPIKRAFKTADHLFDGMVTEPRQSKAGKRFTRAKHDPKKKPRRH